VVTCPKGHQSSATDYCDECGAAIGGARPGPPPGSSPAASTASPAAPDSAGEPCPDCASPRAGRFCEVCGHDFLAEPSPAAPSPAATSNGPADLGAVSAGPAESATSAAGSTGSAPDAGSPDGSASGGAAPAGPAAASGGPTAAPSAVPANGALPVRPVGPVAAGWRVTVRADREYFERARATWGPDADQVNFPAYCPQRVFDLAGPQLLIGRRSRSRGVSPDIDLTGPPEDVGVSHTHALLVAESDGGWSVVDLDSANGTYLNGGTDPLPAHTPTRLHGGDTVHVGAWTTLTVQEP
jgi:hypothetical protein